MSAQQYAEAGTIMDTYNQPRLPLDEERALLKSVALWNKAKDQSLTDAAKTLGCEPSQVPLVLRRLGKDRAKLVLHNQQLVATIASRFRGVPMAERLQEGTIGLIEAIDKFDLSQPVQLSTYAYWKIVHRISIACKTKSRAVRVPQNVMEDYLRFRNTLPKLAGVLGRPPGLADLAQAEGLTLDRVRYVLQMCQPEASLDHRVGEGRTMALIDILDLGQVPDGLAEAIAEENRQELAERLDRLDPIERQVVELRWGLADGQQWSKPQIAAHLNLSEHQTRLALRNGLYQLKADYRADRKASGRLGQAL